MKKKNIFLVKFTVVAAMIGLFSPSVSVKTDVQSSNNYSVIPIQLSVSLLNTAEARRGGGGARRGGGSARRGGSAHRGGASRSRPANRPAGNRPANRPNKNVNRNVNVNKNVNVNHRYYGGHGGRYGYYGGRPILAFTTGLVIGSVIAASTMPSTCITEVYAGVSYRRCDNAYYQPFYQGDTLVYKAVNPPY